MRRKKIERNKFVISASAHAKAFKSHRTGFQYCKIKKKGELRKHEEKKIKGNVRENRVNIVIHKTFA